MGAARGLPADERLAPPLAPRSPLEISVNVSARQVVEPASATSSPSPRGDRARPRTLLLEITETHHAREVDQVIATPRRAARPRGAASAVDDFGTGYSSLVYLRDLPIDILKIDQGFVQRMGIGGQSRELVAAILKMARTWASG